MAEFKLKRGFNIPLAGTAEKVLQDTAVPDTVAILPQEFRGVKPRLLVKEGDPVKIGSPLFTDKQNPEICFVAPVSGKVTAINRGERRKLMEIVVENDKNEQAEKLEGWSADAVDKMDREALTKALLSGGMWPYIIQRPFSVIASPSETPRDIFISGFDTSPLAAKVGFLVKEKMEAFQSGIQVLQKLTDGKVHLSVPKSDSVFDKVQGVEKHVFSGPHPAGNVGVQIHHINPLKRGEMVWQVKPEAVALIGEFFKLGHFPNQRIVAVAGTSLKEQKYFKTTVGAPLISLIPEENIVDHEVRFIAGNVLAGRTSNYKSYVGMYDSLITVIPEGEKKRKLLGYSLPGFKTLSYSRTFFASLIPGKRTYEQDTLLKGGKRAFVMSSTDYQNVVPMDILPVQLAKSILSEDIVEMEGLGILELEEEDLALCSYICLSKTDFGELLRSGLDLIQKEG